MVKKPKMVKPPWVKVVSSDEEGKLVYIPNELFVPKRKHRKKDKWVRLWFYKDRRKMSVSKKNLGVDIEITSKLEYQTDTFYKISQLSADDYYFDYFYKLKTGLPTDIFKKNNRFKTPISDARKKSKLSWKDPPAEKAYPLNDKGEYVVTFD